MNGTYIFEIVNRTIVPSATEELAVVNDNDSRYITFKIPSVIDGIDITDKILTVRYVNSLNRYDQFFCNTREVITEGNEQFVLFDWVLSADVTASKGTVTYDVSIYDTNDISNVSQYILHTKPATFEVEEGLLDIGAPIEDENALQEAIDSFNVIAAKYYNDTLAALKAAQASADAAAKSAASLKVDTTLTISGYAADAKTVGDKLAGKAESSKITSIRNDLQSEIDRATNNEAIIKENLTSISNAEGGVYTFTPQLIDGYVDATTGDVSNYAGTASSIYKRTDYLQIQPTTKTIAISAIDNSGINAHYATALYDKSKSVIASTIISFSTTSILEIPSEAKYIVSSVKNVDSDGLDISILVNTDSKKTNKKIDNLSENCQLISCWGDSTIEGMNMNSAGDAVYNGDNMPSHLLTLLKNTGYSAKVENMGHGGERSTEVCARIGSACFYLAEDITIPASNTMVSLGVSQVADNKVTGSKVYSVLKNQDNTDAQMCLTQTARHTRPLNINGWNLNLYQSTASGGTEHFIQLVNKFGINIVLPKYSAITFGASDRYGINVVHMGINDGANMSLDEWVRRCKSITEKYPKTLICGLYNRAWTFWKNGTGTNDERYAEYVKASNIAFGTNWINLYEVFCTQKCIDTALRGGYLQGRTETQIAADNTAIANHHTCPSLTLNGTESEVHFNTVGYYVFAKTIYDKLVALGWIYN